MTLQTTQIDITGRSGTAIAGLPSWPVAAFPYEADIAATLPENMIAYVQAGRSDLRTAVDPLRERDACDLSRVWMGQSNFLARATDSGVLSGLPRFVGSASDGQVRAYYTDLGQSVTDYTIAVLARVSTGSANNTFLSIGADATARIMLFANTSNQISIQHNSTNTVAAASSITLDEWLPIIASYRDSDKAMRVYAGSTTPIISATMTNSPPASSLASILSLRAGASELNGELVFAAIWDQQVHTDAAALAKLVAAMNGLAAL